MNHASCKTCSAYDAQPNAGEDVGVCKRNPPVVQLVMVPGRRSPANPDGAPALTAQGFSPPVRGSVDWCLQHAPAALAN